MKTNSVDIFTIDAWIFHKKNTNSRITPKKLVCAPSVKIVKFSEDDLVAARDRIRAIAFAQ